MSFDADERRSLQRGLASLADSAREAANCPTGEALWNAARGESSPTETRSVVDHTARCPACAEAWRIATQLDPPGEARPEAARRVAGRRTWLAAAAVLALALLALPFALRQLDPSSDSEFRGRAAPIEALIPETDPLPRDACVLRWTEPVAGSRYGIEVASRTLEILATAEALETNRFQVSPDAIAGLPSGAKIYWRVRAELPDGRVVTGPTFIHTLE